MNDPQLEEDPAIIDGSEFDVAAEGQMDWDGDLLPGSQPVAAGEPAGLRARRAIERLHERRALRSLLNDFPE